MGGCGAGEGGINMKSKDVVIKRTKCGKKAGRA